MLAAERPAWDVTPRPVAARAAERPARDVSSQAVAARASRAVGADDRDPHRGPAFPRDAHEAVSAQRSAEPAASEQPVAAAGAAERDAPPGAVVVGAAERDARPGAARVGAAEVAASRDAPPGVVEVGAAARDARPEAAAEVELPVVAAGLRWAVEAVRDEAPRREAVRAAARPSAAAAWALPSAAALACRRDRVLPSAPEPQRWARPRHTMRSLQIALPSAQSWQAAGDEVWSCGVGSRSQRKRKARRSTNTGWAAMWRRWRASRDIFSRNMRPAWNPVHGAFSDLLQTELCASPCDRGPRLSPNATVHHPRRRMTRYSRVGGASLRSPRTGLPGPVCAEGFDEATRRRCRCAAAGI